LIEGHSRKFKVLIVLRNPISVGKLPERLVLCTVLKTKTAVSELLMWQITGSVFTVLYVRSKVAIEPPSEQITPDQLHVMEPASSSIPPFVYKESSTRTYRCSSKYSLFESSGSGTGTRTGSLLASNSKAAYWFVPSTKSYELFG
jgi:hypothetical protein